MQTKVRETAATRRNLSGYTKATPQCQRCKHFQSEMVEYEDWRGRKQTREANLRCGMGRFKVNKTGWCPSYEAKP